MGTARAVQSPMRPGGTDLYSSHVLLLHIELRLPARPDTRLQLLVLQSGGDPVLEELVYLLGRAADEAPRVEERVELALDRVEVRVAPDALDQVVLEALGLHLVRGLVREDLSIRCSAFARG